MPLTGDEDISGDVCFDECVWESVLGESAGRRQAVCGTNEALLSLLAKNELSGVYCVSRWSREITSGVGGAASRGAVGPRAQGEQEQVFLKDVISAQLHGA
jgi:hypothetical protein